MDDEQETGSTGLEGLDEIQADPDAFYQGVIDKLTEQHGAQWVQEHQKEIRSNWEFTKEQFGF